MTALAIRKKLIQDINNASEQDVKKLYMLHNIIKADKLSGLQWDDLSVEQKEKITTGAKQLAAGKGVPMKKAMEQLSKKYEIS